MSPQFAPRPVDRLVKTVKPPHKATLGGGERTARCSCAKNAHLVKESIRNGLRLIRTRFALPQGELPELGPSELDKYLLFLLGGPSRQPTPFPRAQSGWRDGLPHLTRLGRTQRWMLAQSCASMKRSLPSSVCRQHKPPSVKDEWMARQCVAEPPVSSPRYLAFARKVTRKIFSFGWDQPYYRSFCESFAPKVSSRADRSKASAWWSEQCTWVRFQNAVRNGRLLARKGLDFRYAEVPTAGKMRPMGIPTQDWDYLAPLHKSIYERLTKEKWLMVGPPTPARIGQVAVHPFGTSVDLTAATDGLRLDVAEAILGVICAKASTVPGSIRLLAHESLRPSMDGVEITHGQMMGTYLSFPLLCLQSYIAAKWATRDQEAEYLVNGDDTYISSSDRFVQKEDYPEGMALNDKKTIRSLNVAELNSTTFIKTSQRWKEIVHLRRGAFNADYGGIQHISAACRKAGEKWVTAYFRSRVGYAWRLLPSQMGFSLTNRDAFGREARLKKTKHCPAVPKSELPSHTYRLVRKEEISEDERIAFRLHLFEHGRETEKKGKEWTLAQAKRTFWTPKSLFGRSLRPRTYNRRAEALMERQNGVRPDYMCVPLAYEARVNYKSCIREIEEGEFAFTWW
jgi:hypothetical protein